MQRWCALPVGYAAVMLDDGDNAQRQGRWLIGISRGRRRPLNAGGDGARPPNVGPPPLASMAGVAPATIDRAAVANATVPCGEKPLARKQKAILRTVLNLMLLWRSPSPGSNTAAGRRTARHCCWMEEDL